MNALEKYRPQWFYVKPAGTLEEPFDVPFSFTVAADGSLHLDLPIQMDNEECIIRGIFFNRTQAPIGGVIGTPVDVLFLARLRDTYGNPMSGKLNDDPTKALSLMLGGWANPWGSGCGFPVEPEIRCSSGGVVLMDLSIGNLV